MKRQAGRKGFLLFLVGCILLLTVYLIVARKPSSDNLHGRPSIILISIDTLRADHVSAYGYARATTPFLDSLIRRGTSFSNAVSPAPWTLPAHISLFTALYPHTHGIVHDQLALADDAVTLPMLLKRAGYRTGGFASCLYLFPGYGFDRGFDHYIERNIFPAPALSKEAFTWLLKEEPEDYFLFLHFYDVHPPHDPQQKYLEMFESSYDGAFAGDVESLISVNEGRLELGEEDIRHLMALYDAEIRQLDESLGAFLSALRKSGYLENTVLIILSDHGEEFLDHGGVMHSRTLYDELLKVPLIIVGPDIPIAKKIDEQVQLIDVMPTILELCGIEAPSRTEGTSLLPLIAGKPADWDQTAFAEADKDNEEPDINRAMRTGRYKFYYNRLTGSEFLFDLVLDPDETTNILEREPELGNMHREKLQEWMATEKGSPKEIVFKENERELLRALGYLN